MDEVLYPRATREAFIHEHLFFKDAKLKEYFDKGMLKEFRARVKSKHASKTYATVAAAVAPAAAGECFIIGQFRGGEKARCHLHSSFAVGLYAVVAD